MRVNHTALPENIFPTLLNVTDVYCGNMKLSKPLQVSNLTGAGTIYHTAFDVHLPVCSDIRINIELRQRAICSTLSSSFLMSSISITPH